MASFFSYLRSWLKRGKRPAAWRRPRLTVEALERREVPANTAGTNIAPVLSVLSDQVLMRGQDQLVLSLNGADANGDALSYSARIVGQNVLAQAGQLDRDLGLGFTGSYHTNFQGHNEKWLQGTSAQYFL